MKSITIHKLDNRLAAEIRREADRQGMSMNQVIKKRLAEAFGLAGAPRDDRNDFAEFCGKWSAQQAEAFERATEEFERIDPEPWR